MDRLELLKSPGIYTLIISLPQPVTREVGKLGNRDFSPGIYTYTGSALGRSANLKARIRRHLELEKKRRWHIDYLLDKDTSVEALVYVETSLKEECKVARKIGQLDVAEVLVRGFGSSDCRCGCGSHLHYFPGLGLEKAMLRVADVYVRVFGDFRLIRIYPPLSKYSDRNSFDSLLRAKRLRYLKYLSALARTFTIPRWTAQETQ